MSSPHAGHFFVSVVEYTTPHMVHTLSDFLLTAILLTDIAQKNPYGGLKSRFTILQISTIFPIYSSGLPPVEDYGYRVAAVRESFSYAA